MANPLSHPPSENAEQLPSSVLLARRLLAHDTPAGSSDPEVAAVGLRKTCARVSTTLRNALGADGCNALLVRAVTRTEAQHPLIADLRRSEGNVSFDELVRSVDEHGVVPVSAAVEALLASLIEILARLIGEEMTIRITTVDALARQGTDAEASSS